MYYYTHRSKKQSLVVVAGRRWQDTILDTSGKPYIRSVYRLKIT